VIIAIATASNNGRIWMASLQLDGARACEEAEPGATYAGSGSGLMCTRTGRIKRATLEELRSAPALCAAYYCIELRDEWRQWKQIEEGFRSRLSYAEAM
jgi:hypothetical protein